KTGHQIFCQVNGVVGNLLKAAGSKNQMDILLVISQLRVAAQPTKNVSAVRVNRRSASGSAARQHRIQMNERAQGLSAQMGNSNRHWLQAREIFVIVMFANLADPAAQVGSQLAQPRQIFADVDD